MICERCGIEETSRRMEQRRERKIPILCVSCVARPAKTITTAYGKCVPWHGNFDDEDNPLNRDGSLYFIGERLCGKRDCVAPEHLIKFSIIPPNPIS